MLTSTSRGPSQADVAALAGVSGQTVSRVVSAHPRVDPATRERVEAAMAQLGYRPHRAARALRTGKHQTIALVASTLATVGNIRTLEAVTAVANAHGYAVLVVTASGPDQLRAGFDRLHDHGVDGAIVVNEASMVLPAADLPAGLDLVLIDAELPRGEHAPVPRTLLAVNTDHVGGAATAHDHLHTRGHRRLRMISGPESSFAARSREHGWQGAVRASGAEPLPVLRGDWSSTSGYLAARQLIADSELTAVFVANDQMALGAIRAFTEAGRSVPDDISVVGFDDSDDAANFLPPLTTVRQDFARIGESACAALIAGIEPARADPTHVPASVSVPTELIIRSSTAARQR